MLQDGYQSSFLDDIRKNFNDDEKDFSPFKIKKNQFEIFLPRFFGFCFGVRNAMKIVSKAIYENQDKEKYILSEIIHNKNVNDDLLNENVKFIFDKNLEQKISYDNLKKNDVCIIPAFGTDVKTQNILKEKLNEENIYDTCCPFVKKVWQACKKIGDENATIIIHGKFNHEETKATFSHAMQYGKAIVIKDINQAKILIEAIKNNDEEEFFKNFKDVISDNFDFKNDLKKVGIVNQTTMLAEDTKNLSLFIKNEIEKVGGKYLDFKDTLCYATSRNQQSIHALMNEKLDAVFVIGGFNSSNTTNLYKIAKAKCDKTFFIKDEKSLLSKNEVLCLDESSKEKQEIVIKDYLKDVKKIGIIAGASCPDIIIEKVISFF